MEKIVAEKEKFEKDRSDRVRKATSYLTEKYNLDGQLEWYDRKAVINKAWHMRLGIIIIICGAVTTIIQLWAPSPEGVHWSTGLTALLGALVIVAKGIDSLWEFDKNWSNYRQAAENLKRERRLYINAVGPYENCKDEDSLFNLFVKRIEEVLAAEEKLFWKNNDKKQTDIEKEK